MPTHVPTPSTGGYTHFALVPLSSSNVLLSFPPRQTHPDFHVKADYKAPKRVCLRFSSPLPPAHTHPDCQVQAGCKLPERICLLLSLPPSPVPTHPDCQVQAGCKAPERVCLGADALQVHQEGASRQGARLPQSPTTAHRHRGLAQAYAQAKV